MSPKESIQPIQTTQSQHAVNFRIKNDPQLADALIRLLNLCENNPDNVHKVIDSAKMLIDSGELSLKQEDIGISFGKLTTRAPRRPIIINDETA
jgi:hypothetical protein